MCILACGPFNRCLPGSKIRFCQNRQDPRASLVVSTCFDQSQRATLIKLMFQHPGRRNIYISNLPLLSSLGNHCQPLPIISAPVSSPFSFLSLSPSVAKLLAVVHQFLSCCHYCLFTSFCISSPVYSPGSFLLLPICYTDGW